MSESISIDVRKDATLIVFARPEIRSPISASVLVELETAIDAAAADQARKLIFTGTGDVFASGADLREIAKLDAQSARLFAQAGQRLMSKIAGFEGVTIAAIRGFCFGGALDLSLACDRRFASPDASFCHPGAGLGIMTGWGGTQRLPRLIGEAKALEMLLTGGPYSAEAAAEFGLIEGVFDDPVAAAIEF